MAIDFNEADVAAVTAEDTAHWHFLANAIYDGGTLVTVSVIADIENARPLVRRAHESARA